MLKYFIIFVLLFTTCELLSQSISYNEEFQLNPNSINPQWLQASTTLPNNQIAICWTEDTKNDGIAYDIYSQICDQYGSISVSQFLVNTYQNENGYRWMPAIAALKNNRFVVCWESNNQDGDGMGVYGQVFSNSGIKVGNEFRANTETEGDQVNVCVSELSTGGFIVCWESKEIYAQIFDENGIKVGSELIVNSRTEIYQGSPTVDNFANGGFVVCWDSFTSDPLEGKEIFAQIFDNSGSKVGDEIHVNTYKNDSQNSPEVKSISENKFIVCWNSLEQDGSGFGIFAKVFDMLGTIVVPEFQVNTFTQSIQSGSCIETLSNNRIIITWSSYEQDESRSGIYAQIYNLNLETIGKEFKVNTYTDGSQLNSKVSSFSSGEFFVSWFTDNWPNSYQINAKYFIDEIINHNLLEFENLEPVTDLTSFDINISFKWKQASNTHLNFPWELTYDLYIDNDESFSNPLIIVGIQDTTCQINSLSPGNTYFWKVLARNYYGDSLWSSNVNGFYIDPNATDVEITENSMPEKFELFQNFPNPFNPTTNIIYSLPVGKVNYHVVIKVYDVLGRLVRVLVDTNQQPGKYSVEFNANELTSGIYFYTVQGGKYSVTKKMVLMR